MIPVFVGILLGLGAIWAFNTPPPRRSVRAPRSSSRGQGDKTVPGETIYIYSPPDERWFEAVVAEDDPLRAEIVETEDEKWLPGRTWKRADEPGYYRTVHGRGAQG